MPAKSLYDIVKVEKDRVFVIDLDLPGSRSVTNDAENVWSEIQSLFPGRRLIYRDTENRWDEITCGPLGSGPNAIKYFNINFCPYKEHIPNI